MVEKGKALIDGGDGIGCVTNEGGVIGGTCSSFGCSNVHGFQSIGNKLIVSGDLILEVGFEGVEVGVQRVCCDGLFLF